MMYSSGQNLAMTCHLLMNVISHTCVAIGAPTCNCNCLQSNHLGRVFDFVVRYTKGKVKVCVQGFRRWVYNSIQQITIVYQSYFRYSYIQ